jgi:hypothetical protein
VSLCSPRLLLSSGEHCVSPPSPASLEHSLLANLVKTVADRTRTDLVFRSDLFASLFIPGSVHSRGTMDDSIQQGWGALATAEDSTSVSLPPSLASRMFPLLTARRPVQSPAEAAQGASKPTSSTNASPKSGTSGKAPVASPKPQKSPSNPADPTSPRGQKRRLFLESSSGDELSDVDMLSEVSQPKKSSSPSTSRTKLTPKIARQATPNSAPKSSGKNNYKVVKHADKSSEKNPWLIEVSNTDATDQRWPTGESVEPVNGRLSYHTPFPPDSTKNVQWRRSLGQFLAHDLGLPDGMNLLCSYSTGLLKSPSSPLFFYCKRSLHAF